jgi:hypothetical protein
MSYLGIRSMELAIVVLVITLCGLLEIRRRWRCLPKAKAL